LCHIISKEGIAVNPKKIEAIKICPVPKNFLEVRSFMRLVGYYRIFIEGLSKVAIPITSMYKKETNFEWTANYDETFQHLKELLTSAPILKVVYLDEYFVV
jgi:hypothetical protein